MLFMLVTLALYPLHEASLGIPYPISHFVDYNEFSSPHRAFLASISFQVEPQYYSQAIQDSKWRKAIIQEINAPEDNHIWELAPLPHGKKALKGFIR